MSFTGVTSGSEAKGAQASIRLHLIVGLTVVVLLAGGLGGWASTAEISGALIAPGSIVVESSVKKVQHPTGGVVGQVLVHDGDHVKAGDIVVRLDDTVTKANSRAIDLLKNLNGLLARAARLQAEQQGLDKITFPKALTDQASDTDVRDVMASESKLFDVRTTGRSGQKAQLHERVTQLKEEIAGLVAQAQSKDQEVALVDKELVGVRQLYDQHLVQMTRLTTLERDAARLAGERAQYMASMACKPRARSPRPNCEIIQIDKDMVSDVSKDLRETNDKIGEFVERKVTAEDQLRRVDIRAPQDGIVEQSTVHTVGGVIQAGDAIMMVVPQADDLQAELPSVQLRRTSTNCRSAKRCWLRLSAPNQRTTPEIRTGARSASRPTSPPTSAAANLITPSAFRCRRKKSRNWARSGSIPGMPVEALAARPATAPFTSYLIKPLRDQLMRAFRER